MTSDLSRLALIDERAIYSLAEFQRRVGLTRHGVRTARRIGLRVYYAHGRAYILGADWLEYLRRHGKPDKDSSMRRANDA